MREWDVSPTSGMCPICIRECEQLCEIGKSALRGREVLYPRPELFGQSTAASNKNYVLDWSHFQILTTTRGAQGIEEDSDKAIFPNVDISTEVGGVPLKVPIFTAGLGSTDVAKNNWNGLAEGAAISGTIQVIGENVCGMDENSKIQNGQVKRSEDMEYRVEAYRRFWDGEHGDIVVQTNVEDQELGVDTYAISNLGVDIIERKWGQGAKAIGGEVRIRDLDKARKLKERGYIVLPDPDNKTVQRAFREGRFKSFERHSRVGMPDRKGFIEDVEWLRDQGAERVFLKTGAYRPADVAYTLKVASESGIDLVTFDGAGGGTGMSPVPMMQECSTPTVYLQAQVLKAIQILKEENKHVPDIAMAGGFTNETQILKSIAMSNFGDGPHVKSIAMARGSISAVMKADYFVELAERGALPADFEREHGDNPEQFLIATTELQEKLGEDYEELSPGAVGLYSYYVDRMGTGLQQLMAGSRKFDLGLVDRTDLASLTQMGSRVTGIPTFDEVESDVFERIVRE
ncbi:glutamate synthase [candidate division MSBL1 archaeon SCGC-AAA259I14]|uniref:Glutamate synthase n=3 Tax=candidate division MSBL1 TaxID=215777 RepID=A0A133UPP0_9EURY|nr:glutamate synthase [candidate division MSBL1 archaeon SCGC-AAA259E22]KXA94897.1 glutamate synthase [candidate division MSBL1 archaeon SCGC-AAA259I07]KXA96097.1 glutamate synthase [candidate division MSBL1 archaeon SCGC-AAA259I14]